MEEWKLDFEWLRVRHYVKKALNQEVLPDLQIILLLIGIQETSIFKKQFTKEEKEDLMHVATCELLSKEGYYQFVGNDPDGWPHYKQIRTISVEGEKAQERLLKECIIEYFSLSASYNEVNNEI